MEEDPDRGGGDLLDGRHHLSAAANRGAQEEVRGLHLPRRGSLGQYFYLISFDSCLRNFVFEVFLHP